MLLINRVFFESSKGLSFIELIKADDKFYIKLRLGPKSNCICLNMTDFCFLIVQLESSMVFTEGPLSLETKEGSMTSEFEKGAENFNWIKKFKDNEIERLEGANEDLPKILQAEGELMMYFDMSYFMRDSFEKEYENVTY